MRVNGASHLLNVLLADAQCSGREEGSRRADAKVSSSSIVCGKIEMAAGGFCASVLVVGVGVHISNAWSVQPQRCVVVEPENRRTDETTLERSGEEGSRAEGEAEQRASRHLQLACAVVRAVAKANRQPRNF